MSVVTDVVWLQRVERIKLENVLETPAASTASAGATIQNQNTNRRSIVDFTDGESVDEVFLLTDKQLRANRNANLYLLAELRDRSGVISGRMWNATEESTAHLQAGELVQVRGKVQLFQGAMQMIVTHIFPATSPGLDPADFVPQTGRDVERLASRLQELLHTIQDIPIRNLMDSFLIDEEIQAGLAAAPAGIRAHHAYAGGLLEHIVTMLEIGHRIADLYADLNHDLLLAGIFLHDIGKLKELSYEHGFAYTDEGQLIGHVVIAIEMLAEKIRQVEEFSGEEFPQETALRLKHLIVSHHGHYQYGSPKLPMTPEAIALHHIDNLDAKVHEFTRDIQDDPNPHSRWTPFNARNDRKLYKGERNTKS